MGLKNETPKEYIFKQETPYKFDRSIYHKLPMPKFHHPPTFE